VDENHAFTEARVILASAINSKVKVKLGYIIIHLKGAPEVERRRLRGGRVWGGSCAPSTQNSCISYQNGELLCIPGDIYCHCSFFKKGTLIKRAGVRTLSTPHLDRPRGTRLKEHDRCMLG